MSRNAKICGALDNLFGDCKTHVWVLGYASVVIGNRHHRHIVFFHQWQHHFHPIFFASHGIEKWATFGGGQAIFQSSGHGAVDAQGRVNHRLHALDQSTHQGGFYKVIVRIAGIFGHFI